MEIRKLRKFERENKKRKDFELYYSRSSLLKPWGYILDEHELRCFAHLLRMDEGKMTTPFLAAGLLVYHVLTLVGVIKTELHIGQFKFLPDTDVKRSHNGYHVVSSIVASIIIGFTIVLFWGIFNYKEDLVWAWILANCTFCVIYVFLGVYGLTLRYMWFTLECLIILGFIMVFLLVVCPYYKLLTGQNMQSRRINNANPSTSKKVPK